MIRFSIDARAVQAALQDVEVRQIPYIMKLGMNALGNAAQQSVREGLQARFTLKRKTWNLNAIKIEKLDRATKTNWRVILRLDPRASYLEKFEEEGYHHPFGGRNYLWVPNERVFRKRIIMATNPLHPKNLNMRQVGGRVIGDQRTYMIRTSTGPMVLQRMGTGKGRYFRDSSIKKLTLDSFGQKRGGKLMRDKTKGTQVLYVLRSSVRVPLKLEFVWTISKVVRAQATPIFREALGKALRTARR
jgi:hypothetical protein